MEQGFFRAVKIRKNVLLFEPGNVSKAKVTVGNLF